MTPLCKQRSAVPRTTFRRRRRHTNARFPGKLTPCRAPTLNPDFFGSVSRAGTPLFRSSSPYKYALAFKSRSCRSLVVLFSYKPVQQRGEGAESVRVFKYKTIIIKTRATFVIARIMRRQRYFLNKIKKAERLIRVRCLARV